MHVLSDDGRLWHSITMIPKQISAVASYCGARNETNIGSAKTHFSILLHNSRGHGILRKGLYRNNNAVSCAARLFLKQGLYGVHLRTTYEGLALMFSNHLRLALLIAPEFGRSGPQPQPARKDAQRRTYTSLPLSCAQVHGLAQPQLHHGTKKSSSAWIRCGISGDRYVKLWWEFALWAWRGRPDGEFGCV
ncbi:hypothetical protein P280DRAFT_323834 [Massarina eburnea CBS 473.64]|uniref:Uncharacterized protein n=1 Tax=Massarina eburnea CBS 473.64 TaxID=1395130 RepID=A0A6A6S0G0_9PLEO|nr:hypothetical protein P280DRAFT_323834 [Massarina eburnea CBS 473.64]